MPTFQKSLDIEASRLSASVLYHSRMMYLTSPETAGDFDSHLHHHSSQVREKRRERESEGGSTDV